jgi:hypothetical protein
MEDNYIVQDKSIIKILDTLDDFMTKFNKLIKQYPNYSYTIYLVKTHDNIWESIVRISKYENKQK